MFEKRKPFSRQAPRVLLPGNKATAQTSRLFEPQIQSTYEGTEHSPEIPTPFLFPQVFSWLVLNNPPQFPGPHFLPLSSGLPSLKKDVRIDLPWESITALLHSLPPVNISVEKPGWA